MLAVYHLRRAIRIAGSVKALGRMVGLSRQTIHEYLTQGITVFGAYTIAEGCRGVSMEQLLGRRNGRKAA